MLLGISFDLLFAAATANTNSSGGLFGSLNRLATDRALAVLGGGKLLQSSQYVGIELRLTFVTAECDLDAGGFALGIDCLAFHRALGVDGVCGESAGEAENQAQGEKREEFFHSWFLFWS